MARFIPISCFSSLYGSHAELLSPEGLSSFKEKLVSSEVTAICSEHRIDRGELETFIKSLENPEHILFYGWVSENKTLELMLDTGDLHPYEDTSGHLKHQLAGNFKRFVAPYLSEKLLRFSGQEDATLLTAFSFVRLLDDDHRAVVEGQLFSSISKRIKAAKDQMRKLVDEQELVNLITPLCTDEVIGCLNQLSRAMYATKLNYVDDLLLAIRTKSCSARFANWLLKRMELVELNKEHAYKINDLRTELREGSLQVRNNLSKGRSPIRWRAILTTLSFLLIVAFTVYVIVYEPFSEVQETELSGNTSFTQFTVDERKKIDSLLKEMKGSGSDDDWYIDNGIPIMGGSTSIQLRTKFDNDKMEQIYQDLSKDANLQQQGYSDTCTSALSFKRIAGVKDLSKKKGKIEAMLRNDAEYDVLLYVAKNNSSGDVHSALIKSGDTYVFELDKGNTLLLVAGNTFQKYDQPNVTPTDLPSTLYTHHFCDTDYNFGESINTPYVVEHISQGKTKFLVTGDIGSYFQLVDIYAVLEPM